MSRTISAPGGALAVPKGDEIVPLVNRLIGQFEHVVLTQDWHPRGHSSFASTHKGDPFSTIKLDYGDQTLWPDHCVQQTKGAEFHRDLVLGKSELILRKGFRAPIDSYSLSTRMTTRPRPALADICATAR